MNQHFLDVYRDELARAVSTHPAEYRWELYDVPKAVAMTRALLADGKLSLDPRARHATCARLGVADDPEAIWAALRIDRPGHVD